MSPLLMLLDGTASTAATPPAQHGFQALLDYFPLTNTVILLVFAVVAFWWNWKKNDRENQEWERKNDERVEAKIAKATAQMSTDIAGIKQQNKDFMPRSEIERGFEHARTNREQIQLIIRDHIKNSQEQTTLLRIQLGQVEQAHRGLEQDVGEIKSELKEVRAEIKSGFKDVNDCLMSISKKVG